MHGLSNILQNLKFVSLYEAVEITQSTQKRWAISGAFTNHPIGTKNSTRNFQYKI